MDCPLATKYQSRLACFSVPNQHRIHQYLLFLAAQQRADTTLAAVVTTLTTLCQVPGKRPVVLTADLTQTTAQDISAFITAAQASGLAPFASS
jgi:hypothetical protein